MFICRQYFLKFVCIHQAGWAVLLGKVLVGIAKNSIVNIEAKPDNLSGLPLLRGSECNNNGEMNVWAHTNVNCTCRDNMQLSPGARNLRIF